MDEFVRFKLLRKIKVRGYYAEIALKTETFGKGEKLELVFDSEPEQFKSALLFGADYFYEYYQRRGHNNKIRITVRDFKYIPVDTTFTTSVYVIVKALSQAIGVEVAGLKLDEESGDFNFPNP